LIATSFAFASGAAVLFLLGARRSRVKPDLAHPPVVQPISDDAPAPPLPAVPVASQPLEANDPNAERRVGFRRMGNPVEVLGCDAEFKNPPLRGWVVDRSRHGLRLSLLDKFANDTVLQIRPATAPDSLPWLALEVRNAQPGEKCWELGCRFQQEPLWEVLLHFG
jgi:hypothetical protein